MSQSNPEDKARFTPGPWQYDGLNYFFDSKNNMIAEIRGCGWDAPIDANARLIAAAPEMHHLLTLVMLAIHGKLDVEDLAPNIRKLFVKVEGD
jgi:hypothetical protein